MAAHPAVPAATCILIDDGLGATMPRFVAIVIAVAVITAGCGGGSGTGKAATGETGTVRSPFCSAVVEYLGAMGAIHPDNPVTDAQVKAALNRQKAAIENLIRRAPASLALSVATLAGVDRRRIDAVAAAGYTVEAYRPPEFFVKPGESFTGVGGYSDAEMALRIQCGLSTG